MIEAPLAVEDGCDDVCCDSANDDDAPAEAGKVMAIPCPGLSTTLVAVNLGDLGPAAPGFEKEEGGDMGVWAERRLEAVDDVDVVVSPPVAPVAPPASVSPSSNDAPKVPASLLVNGGVGAGVPSSDAVAALRLGRAFSLGANRVWPFSMRVLIPDMDL